MKLTKSEQEVLSHLRGDMNLPTITLAGYGRYKRHEKAIASLKEKGLIYRGKDGILKIK